MNESKIVMMNTGKDKFLKNDIHIYASRIHEEPTDLPFCHRHDFFTIEHVIEGTCTQYINGKEYECNKGSICILSPFDEHKYVIKDHAVIDYICIGDDNIFPEVWEYLNVDKAPYMAKLSEDEFQRVVADFDMLEGELTKQSPMYQVNAKALANKIIVSVLRNASEDEINTKSADLREVISYIRYHFREPLTLEGVASMFHVTPSHFCKYFKKNTFYTFKEYLIALRLDYAMRLLKTTDKTISEVCFESGFSSPSYFSKLFIRRFGKSPSQCR